MNLRQRRKKHLGNASPLGVVVNEDVKNFLGLSVSTASLTGSSSLAITFFKGFRC